MVACVAMGLRGLAPLLAFGLGGFAAAAAVRQLVLSTRRQGLRGLVRALAADDAGRRHALLQSERSHEHGEGDNGEEGVAHQVVRTAAGHGERCYR